MTPLAQVLPSGKGLFLQWNKCNNTYSATFIQNILNVIITSTPEANDQLHLLVILQPGKDPQVCIHRRLSGPQSHPWHSDKGNNRWPCLKLKSHLSSIYLTATLNSLLWRTSFNQILNFHFTANLYTDWAAPAHLL
jgi:hypothetical protein